MKRIASRKIKGPNLPPALQQAASSLTQRWGALSARERQLVALAAAVVGLGLFWMVFIQPPINTLRSAPAELERLDAQRAKMLAMAQEALVLRGGNPAAQAGGTAQPARSLAQSALTAATERLGESAGLAIAGDRATLTFSAIEIDALRGWLIEARRGARAQLLEVQLRRTPAGLEGKVVAQLPAGT